MDDEEEEPKKERRALWSALALLAAVGYGFSLIHAGVENPPKQQTSASATPTTTTDSTPTAPPLLVPHPALADGISSNETTARSAPVHITIQRISVDATVIPLTASSAGSVSPPPSREAAEVGWNKSTVAPGEVGPAVLVGRTAVSTAKSAQTPVFRSLDQLRKGDHVTITRANHSTSDFVVDSVETGTGTPDSVYAQTGRPELRLVGYAGSSAKSDTVIVVAHLT